MLATSESPSALQPTGTADWQHESWLSLPTELSVTPLGHPVEVLEDGGVRLDPSAMLPNHPYLFPFVDHFMVVVKRPDTELQIFYVPNDYES